MYLKCRLFSHLLKKEGHYLKIKITISVASLNYITRRSDGIAVCKSMFFWFTKFVIKNLNNFIL